MLLLLLAAAATGAAKPPPAPPPPKPADAAAGFAEAQRDLHSQVVAAIRNCGGSDPDIASGGAILVCSRDRGFSEEDAHRVRKLAKPKPVESGSGIHIEVGPPPPGTPPLHGP